MEVSIAWLIAALVIGYVAGNERGYNEGRKFGWLNGRLDSLSGLKPNDTNG